MKKLSLKLDTLSVDSFETGRAPQLRGTVRGHITNACATATDCGTGITVCDVTCTGKDQPTYPGVGNGTCDPTCQGWTCQFQTCSPACTATSVPECATTMGRDTCDNC
jgi:hypothetical protein